MEKKRLIIVGSTIIGLLVLLLIVLWIISIFNHRYNTYEQVEEKMVEATKVYYKKNPQQLPTSDGKSTLSYNTLVENELIQPLNKLLKDGDSCTAEINVIKNEHDYVYIPKLACSDKYVTIELISQVLKNHEVVTEGSGLYSDGQGGYYFRGKVDDNYVALGTFQPSQSKKERISILWQIMEITADNKIKIRALHSAGNTVFDNRFNEGQKKKTGYNDFEMSIMKDTLKSYEENESFLTNSEKSLLEKSKLCLGKRSLENTSTDGSVECAVQSNDEYLFGLMYPYEYIRASIDENCKNMTSRSCQNYNLLSGSGFYTNWTTIPVPNSDFETYIFDGITYEIAKSSTKEGMYFTSYLNPYVIFKSGDGTRDNPYRLK